MNATRFPYTITLATAAAAVLLGAAQFAGIDSLAAPKRRRRRCGAGRRPAAAGRRGGGARSGPGGTGRPQRLPTVVVTGHAVRTVAKSALQTPAI